MPVEVANTLWKLEGQPEDLEVKDLMSRELQDTKSPDN
jgi:hypothetical protein